MTQFVIAKKILSFLAPLVLLYLTKKFAKNKTERKSRLARFDEDQIVDGEIVKDKSNGRFDI